MSIQIPVDCPRGLTECKALATIESDCGKSFVCCGHNDGTTRKLEQDRFTFCMVNDENDTLYHYDDQDMKDNLSVLAQALSADQHIKQEREP